MDNLFLGTVYDVTSDGVRITFDGNDSPTNKRYKRLNSASLSSGDRILAVKQSGTYIILGKIT